MPSSTSSTSTNAANCGARNREGATGVAGLNHLLAPIIIYWNTLKLGDAVFTRRHAGLEILPGRAPGPTSRRLPLAGYRPDPIWTESGGGSAAAINR